MKPALLGALLAFAGCATAPSSPEPPNLQPAKEAVRRYVDSGQYERDIAAVAGRAAAWLEQRTARRAVAGRLAIVFDLDETLFSNWPEISGNDFGYNAGVWEEWVESAQAPAIAPVRALYRTARRLGVDVIFLTGRPERQRAATERNLRAIDCAECAALICASDDSKQPTGAFKLAERKRLAAGGRTIVANIGDQESDLAGGYAERTFKLPDPFYLTP